MCKVKVCGITDVGILPVLNALTPDYAGFILTSGFKRSVSEEFASAARKTLCGAVKTVGVFVNDDPKRIAGLVKAGIVDLIQLHGDEDGEYIRIIKASCSAPIIKSVHVTDGKVSPYPDNCDFVLLDAYSPHMRGGTGKRIEWRRYEEIKKPVFLAGGITPDNVKDALAAVQPYCVDCSGGVETDGIKDADKIEKYIKNVREFEKYGKQKGQIR